MANIYAENASRQYGVPAEVMNAVAWAEDAYDAASINASAANLRAEYQKHGNWNDALYAHSMGTTADAERATQFTQTVLEVAGYAQGAIPADESGSSWGQRLKELFILPESANDTLPEYDFSKTLAGRVMSSGGVILLGVVLIGIAVLSVPAVRSAAKTVATKGAA